MFSTFLLDKDNVDAYVDRALGVCETIAGHKDYFFGNYVVMRGDGGHLFTGGTDA